MDDIKSLLNKQSPNEPQQVSELKKYALATYDISLKVRVTSKSYTVLVPNAALAHKFRLDKDKIIEECSLDKALIIHIG